jgi:hypothetical protein
MPRHIVSVKEVATLLGKAAEGGGASATRRLQKAKVFVPPAEKLRDLADAMTMMGARYLYASRSRGAWALLTIKKGRLRARRLRHMAQYPVTKGPLWPDPKSGKRPIAWHCEAELLLEHYRRGVWPGAGIWRDGPTVKFLQLALERVGLGRREPRTIEQALKRAQGRRARRCEICGGTLANDDRHTPPSSTLRRVSPCSFSTHRPMRCSDGPKSIGAQAGRAPRFGAT